ncbi:DUF1801 domain-containing protein [Pararhizobium arenae]|uniref:DUF1801 domain-containing protein n=1 Tax=Pararhizobium arenae TaxID=1856850 RepID=UPI00315AA86C
MEHPFYGVPGKGWIVAFHCFDRYVKVTFFKGTSLSPPPPVASKQDEVRYVHVHEHEEFNEELLRDWLTQAACLPGVKL